MDRAQIFVMRRGGSCVLRVTMLTFLEKLIMAFGLFCSDAIFQVNVLTFKRCFMIASRRTNVFFTVF